MSQIPHTPASDDADTFQELAAAFALGALDPAEVAAFREHLEGCRRCRSLVAEYAAVAAALPETLDEMEASPSLRGRVLSAAWRERPIETPPSPAAHDVRRPTRGSIGQGRSRLWASAAAALFVAAIGLGSWNAQLQQRLDQQSFALMLQRQALDAVATGARQWPLVGTQEAPRAEGVIVQAEGERDAYLLVRALPTLPADRAYQAWVITEGKPAGAGILAVDAGGPYMVRLERPLAGVETVAVTSEPVGGSPSPTGPIVVAATL